MGSGSRQRARIMITVKTYPELSNKYRETSCVAGIRLDEGAPRHVRLFPVPFRLLREEDQFRKYSIIEIDVESHGTRDSRPESLRPDFSINWISCSRTWPHWSGYRWIPLPVPLRGQHLPNA